MKYCGNCGKELPDSSKYCTYCGQDLKSFQSQKTKTTGMLVSLLLVLCIVVASLALLFINKKALDRNTSETVASAQADIQETTSEQTTEAVTTETPTTEKPKEMVFEKIPSSYYWSPGVGNLNVSLKINKDGSFTGSSLDMDMGVGASYVSAFKGQFSEPERKANGVYSVKITDLTYTKEPGIQRDGEIYVDVSGYGFGVGKEFEIYYPGTKTSQLSQGFVQSALRTWWLTDYAPETLMDYAIYSDAAEIAYRPTD